MTIPDPQRYDELVKILEGRELETTPTDFLIEMHELLERELDQRRRIRTVQYEVLRERGREEPR